MGKQVGHGLTGGKKNRETGWGLHGKSGSDHCAEGGYVRSHHMCDMPGHDHHDPDSKPGGIQPNYHTSGEKKKHGSDHRLPGEHNIAFSKGVTPGDDFESEIKEHFPGGDGVAGMSHKGEHHKTWETKDAHGHGKASGKAEHHKGEGDGQGELQDGKKDVLQSHAFSKHPQGHMAHGYGHDHEKKLGHLRLSGHASAHRIGKR